MPSTYTRTDKDREHGRLYMARWRAANPSKYKAQRTAQRAVSMPRIRQLDAEWHRAHPLTDAAYNRQIEKCFRWKYGISRADKQAMFIAQGSCCAVCGTNDPGNARGHWHTDHNPSLKKGDPKYIRGILCHHCNLSAHRKTSPRILRLLALYLEKHQ